MADLGRKQKVTREPEPIPMPVIEPVRTKEPVKVR